MRIAVAGGTGTVGRHVVDVARSAGHEVTVVSRTNGVDVTTGEGLADALAGAEVVIDVTNVVTLSARRSRRFFEMTTRHLLEAGRAAGVGHHLALSIVGIDDIDASYYAGKLAQERAIERGGVPFSIARTGQFHEFAGQLLAGMRGPVAMIPKALIRPVAAREVAANLVRIAEGGPAGRAPDLVGPCDERLADLARRQLAFDGVERRVVEVRLPGRYGRGLASGSLRGTSDMLQGSVSFEDWLRSSDRLGDR